MTTKPIDLKKLRVYPLARRKSQARLTDVLVDLTQPPPPCSPHTKRNLQDCARRIREARQAGASVILMFGAHLVKNGGATVVTALLDGGWVTHLATNGAGAIHDWEFAHAGCSTEKVAENVAAGCFGTWRETGRNLHLALLAGGLTGLGFGAALGEFIEHDGVELADREKLARDLRRDPAHPLSGARADLLCAMIEHRLRAGRHTVRHPWKNNSIFAQACRRRIPLTVHPGIGYDIISNHPMFNGAAIGRAAALDFRLLGGSVERLDGGVVLSVGSAIMAPQVFEKSLSCVNNLRLKAGRAIVKNHRIFVVDLQQSGGWDWRKGEPPKDNPAYYQRYCKSFSRMGGEMIYTRCDNTVFLRHLLRELQQLAG